MGTRLRILHAIHDFLPRHRAGSEIYAFALGRQQARDHDVHILCAEYDPARAHGSITRRAHEGLPVVELVNNWVFRSFEETYDSSRLNRQLDHVLQMVLPDVLHIHSLLNLSMALPTLARARGIPSVATLHDYTLMCPSGGQRVHLAEKHLCADIDPDRCRRCFPQSFLHTQLTAGRIIGQGAGLAVAARVARAMLGRVPRVFGAIEEMAKRALGPERTMTADQIRRRLEKAREVFEVVDLFVAPSAALAADVKRFGVPADKIVVSDYGFPPLPAVPRRRAGGRLRVGFVGTLVWHKGVHVLVEAARQLPADRFEVLLFGDPDTFPGYVSALRDRARGLPVRFMGEFDNRAAAEIYAQMDVLVVPSLWFENSPLVIHEAFMAGLPVVGSRQGGIPGLVTHEVNGLLYDAFSPAALAATLRSLIDDPDRLQRLAGSLPAVKTIEQDAREWDARYRRALEGRTGQAGATPSGANTSGDGPGA